MAFKGGYKGAEVAPIIGGRCSKHGEAVAPFTRICLSCHHEALELAGFDWQAIGTLRDDMSGGAGGWRARNEERAA